jgi:hypothetical protein
LLLPRTVNCKRKALDMLRPSVCISWKGLMHCQRNSSGEFKFIYHIGVWEK